MIFSKRGISLNNPHRLGAKDLQPSNHQCLQKVFEAIEGKTDLCLYKKPQKNNLYFM